MVYPYQTRSRKTERGFCDVTRKRRGGRRGALMGLTCMNKQKKRGKCAEEERGTGSVSGEVSRNSGRGEVSRTEAGRIRQNLQRKPRMRSRPPRGAKNCVKEEKKTTCSQRGTRVKQGDNLLNSSCTGKRRRSFQNGRRKGKGKK